MSATGPPRGGQGANCPRVTIYSFLYKMRLLTFFLRIVLEILNTLTSLVLVSHEPVFYLQKCVNYKHESSTARKGNCENQENNTHCD